MKMTTNLNANVVSLGSLLSTFRMHVDRLTHYYYKKIKETNGKPAE